MIDGNWLRPVVCGLLGGLAVVLLAAFSGKAPEDGTGWQRVVPAPMHWIAIALGTGMVLVMGYVRLFVGSMRADAEQQMVILTWLIGAFALGTLGVALSIATIRRRAVRWRGPRVVWFQGGDERTADFADLAAVDSGWTGYVMLRFMDGTVLKLDPYARGAQELIGWACEHLAPDDELWDDAA